MNVVTAMTRLWLQRPRPHRSTADAAAWYAARSALHQQIALLGGPDSEHARLRAERAASSDHVRWRLADEKGASA